MKRDLGRAVAFQIKIQAKMLGLTQAQLAKRLSVSLPTIKRWYQGDFVTLENLQRLCDELGLSIADVFAQADSKTTSRFQYTLAQESFLAENPATLAYFDLLLKGLSARAIEKKTELSPHKSARFLAQLEKLKLIKWLKDDRVQVLVEGEPVWRKDGPLAKTLGAQIREAFLNSTNSNAARFFLQSYLPDDLATLRAKLEDVSQFATIANNRAKRNPEEAKPHGLYFAVAPFIWNPEKILKGVF